jgi:hypothetical protein
MGRVSVDSLVPGMVLAQDAYTFKRQLLLRTGTTLTERHIETIQAWGVAEVDVEGHTEATLGELDAQLAAAPGLAAASAALDARFGDLKSDPLMREILRIAKKQLLEDATS